VKIFLAGATGVLGVRLVPLLVDTGHEVVGMTRSPDKVADLTDLGASPVVCDVYDRPALIEAVVAAAPDLLLHELTDLPDNAEQLPEFGRRNTRMRTEGTDNLLAAMRAAGARRVIAQSIAWRVSDRAAEAVDHLESAVLALDGIVLRYGQFHGPGTYYPDPDALPDEPRVGLDRAATATVEHLESPSGIYTITD
jgi:D-arabinose 1-dehydrogenase-like Zn-dependent alcohol dehydrogenase